MGKKVIAAGSPIVKEDVVARSSRKRVRSPRSRHRREEIVGFVFVLPDIIGLSVFVGLPVIVAVATSFFYVSGFGTIRFIGVENYARLISDPLFWKSLNTTVLYGVVSVPLLFIVSLAIALLLRHPFPGVKVVRTIIFVPHALSLVVIAILWGFILADKKGLLPVLLQNFGIFDISFLGDPKLALGSYIAITIWFLVGYQMILFLSGLSDIPVEYEDAARVDGANWWQRFRHVIWPLLRPTSLFIGVTTMIGAFTGPQAFDLVFVLTGGGPAHATTTSLLYIYDQAFTFGNFGYAAAITTVLIVILSVATGAWFRFTRGGRTAE